MNKEKRLGIKKCARAGDKEFAAAVATYIIAYLYAHMLTCGAYRLWFGVFALLFVLLGEYLCRGRKRIWESWVWLGCLVIISACAATGHGRVWGETLPVLCAHVFGGWWWLARANRLAAGESGRFLPLDAVNGFLRFPFKNFFLRLRCLRQGARGVCREYAGQKRTTLGGIAAALLGAALLYCAASALAAADSGFERLAAAALDFLRPADSALFGRLLLRFALSLPVGAWLFGLFAGALRTSPGTLRREMHGVEGAIENLRVVPDRVWTACAAAFIGVYALFFALQGSYLFGAFFRRMPEGFIVSEYARRGFFELCRVMAINFALLWLMTRTGRTAAEQSRGKKIMCTLLLAASMLFAIVAFSKLALYISCFGFTPKRLQSTWLVSVLFMGCADALYSLWTGKKSFQYWMIFGAVTLALLHLV